MCAIRQTERRKKIPVQESLLNDESTKEIFEERKLLRFKDRISNNETKIFMFLWTIENIFFEFPYMKFKGFFLRTLIFYFLSLVTSVDGRWRLSRRAEKGKGGGEQSSEVGCALSSSLTSFRENTLKKVKHLISHGKHCRTWRQHNATLGWPRISSLTSWP